MDIRPTDARRVCVLQPAVCLICQCALQTCAEDLILGGWSLGALPSSSLVMWLQAAGVRVRGLFLLDPRGPGLLGLPSALPSHVRQEATRFRPEVLSLAYENPMTKPRQ